MPYLKPRDREKFYSLLAILNGLEFESAGELNYALTLLAHRYVASKGIKYQNLNDVMGAFSGASQEFYRKIVAPYEELKIKENGGVAHEVYLNSEGVKNA